MGIINSKYTKVLIIFGDGGWLEYDGIDPDKYDVMDGQMIIGITSDGTTDILKNRYGNSIGLSGPD